MEVDDDDDDDDGDDGAFGLEERGAPTATNSMDAKGKGLALPSPRPSSESSN